ncbi:MAG: RNA polymerase factor sigma-54 [Candidatus Marinimicrobia bacterium]|jgi:RNA polymerase sigma-54 factor|nr:RNA polymerase factor sigma-54 [Candidatus Neomarinimicrobiota bacterium]MBT3676852.1 RNA polymerase factor sigma-54 [Candidatus Neomarinimicrobiota bacterium]MBT3763427.1 RNA polymerase factor sigma-54 [Candidatus Neomarinimicrobiota bacterium]MBT4068107.1 RNA polymerase factor sigma-54 [Candidatus Neomarinimicrobiota bacterium]MBT4271201.1 RNA polymerase factor sigma-54 [Candidatus Neomarinimicrobiota bacterium]
MPRLKQSQTQRQSLSPQQVLQASILQLNTINLEQKIMDELESNPVLDQADPQEEDQVVTEESAEVDYEEDPDEYEPANIYDNQRTENREIPVAEQVDFVEGLVRQLDSFKLSEWERAIAEEILWNLDENGYLAVDLVLIADRYDRTDEEVNEVLEIVHQLDPPGIGARHLQDCLLIQMRHEKQTLAYQVIAEYFDDFANHRYDNLKNSLDISKELLAEIIEDITHLNPRPGEGKIRSGIETVIPDLLAVRQDGKWVVIVNDTWIPDLNLSNEYLTLMNQVDLSRDTQKYLKEKFDSATWFIQAIQQRRYTLTTVMNSIIGRQPDFFKGKIEILIPMKLQDIADEIKMDISTISRSTRGKYVDTPYGIFELKSFFTEAYTLASGEEISTNAIKDLLKKLINNEDKDSPLTDTDLANQMEAEGFPVARRTVAKYREQLHLPVARLRRQLTT